MAAWLSFLIPILWTVALAAAVLRWHYRGRGLYFGLAAVALLAVGQLTLGSTPNYLWSVLLAAVVIAIVVISLVMSQAGDFLLGLYAHWVSRVLALATMIWWLAGVILFR